VKFPRKTITDLTPSTRCAIAMPEEKHFPSIEGFPEPWSFEANRDLQLRMGLKLTPAERLRWLEETVEELLPWVGRAQQGKPVGS
jgi:hypothetical protein